MVVGLRRSMELEQVIRIKNRRIIELEAQLDKINRKERIQFVKVVQISEEAIRLYQEGLAIETVAEELGVSYRTARKAINLNGAITRDPSTRVKGRTDPRGGKKVTKKR